MSEFVVAAMVLVSLSSTVVGEGGGVFSSLASGVTQPNCRLSASVWCLRCSSLIGKVSADGSIRYLCSSRGAGAASPGSFPSEVSGTNGGNGGNGVVRRGCCCIDVAPRLMCPRAYSASFFSFIRGRWQGSKLSADQVSPRLELSLLAAEALALGTTLLLIKFFHAINARSSSESAGVVFGVHVAQQ